jgi:hypothetical protein
MSSIGICPCALQSDMNKYRLVAKKGEGTFSEVLKAQCIKNGKYVAIKCMKVSEGGLGGGEERVPSHACMLACVCGCVHVF